MPTRASARRRTTVVTAIVLLGLVLAAASSTPAQAAPAGWADLTVLSGSSRAWVGTVTQQAAGFPVAQMTSTSVGGSSVGRQTGASTYLADTTPVGEVYGSSENRPYYNLRPNNQNGPPPSVTTYAFERPTPASGWTFVLGDIDADQVTITATGVGGEVVPTAALGFRETFNYCVPGVCTGTDLPTWDSATGILRGNAGAIDTNGASAWFEPTVPLTSLTFTFAQRAGFPVYQTWFSALEYDVTGTVTAPEGEQQGITVVLYGPEGTEPVRTTTDENGSYRFPGYATYDDYTVQVIRPPGLTSDDPLTQTVDLSEGDVVADFTLREIVPVPASGTVRDADGNPVAGVTLTLTGPDGEPRTTTSDADGTYVFDDVPVGDGWTVTASAPDDSAVSGPRTFDVPVDSETPIENLDFVITFPDPPATGSLSGRVFEQGGGPLGGIPIQVVGPGGATYSAVTGPDGTWQLDGLPPGSYTVTVQAPEGTTVVGQSSLEPTIPEDGGETAGLNFELAVLPLEQEPLTAGGTVTTADGDPVAGAVITVVDPVTEQERTATTGADGSWSLDGLAPAQGYTAEITVPDGYEAAGDTSITFDATEEDVTGLDFELTLLESSPTPTPTPTVTPTPTPTTSTSAPTYVDSDDPYDDGPDDSSSDSGSDTSSSLASTGGPSLLIGAAGVALVLAGLLSVAYGFRRRRG